MSVKLKTSALAVVAAALAAALAPPEAIAPSAWAARNLILPDGPHKGELFNPAITPYLIEPLDAWADDAAVNRIVVRKSKQTGFTTLALAAIGYTACVEPADTFLIEPSDSFLKDFNSEKLQRAIDASPALAARIRPQISHSARGSTTKRKRFPGGSLLMALATSTADLRGKTRRKIIKDESSEYPADLEGQGSPHDMIAGSYESFLASGDWKQFDISTPVIKGACYIDAEFEKGDQRYWTMNCPGCAAPFRFEFKPGKTFRFEKEFPFKAHYVTECCGIVIAAHEKNALVRTGRWVATAPGPGKHRSYHFDALASPFVPWDEIARRYIEAKDNPAKLKTFDNLTLGLAHEARGDAPDHVRLMERREDYDIGRVPPRGLLLVAGCDVQHSGIWYEIVAFAANAESWSVRHGFLEGETTDPQAGAFLALAELYDETFPDAFGARRSIDALAVDAGDGGRANQVYAWARARQRAFAVKGMAGWTQPAIGTPTRVDITLKGQRIKGGATLWPIGTWSLKATFYANLGKDGRKAGQPVDPPGYCHFHAGCDERFFRQQTAEYLKTVTFRGRSSRIWQEIGPNHLLDCRVYAMAMAEYLGLTRMTGEQWQRLEQLRGVPATLKEPDLLAPEAVKIAARPSLLERPSRRGPRVSFRSLT